MIKYHLADGSLKPCTATKRACKYPVQEHYEISSIEELKKKLDTLFAATPKNDTFVSSLSKPGLVKLQKDKKARLEQVENAFLETDNVLLQRFSQMVDKRNSAETQEIDVAVHMLAKYTAQTSLFQIFREEEIEPDSYRSPYPNNELLGHLHALTYDVNYAINHKDNILNPKYIETNGEDWEPKYKKELGTYMIEKGNIVRFNESYYGWRDYELIREDQKLNNNNNNNNNNQIVAMFNIKEKHWSEFAGTFADTGEGEYYGAEAEVVLANGQNRIIRIEESLSDILLKFLNPKKSSF